MNFNEATLRLHRRIMSELIQRDKNHPSVVMWSVANEPQTDLPESEEYFEQVEVLLLFFSTEMEIFFTSLSRFHFKFFHTFLISGKYFMKREGLIPQGP